MDLSIGWQEFPQQALQYVPLLIGAPSIFGAGMFPSGWAASKSAAEAASALGWRADLFIDLAIQASRDSPKDKEDGGGF